jgi:hypothetical protein
VLVRHEDSECPRPGIRHLNEERQLHSLMTHLPVFGTLAMAALFTGPLARLPIDAGDWLLERCLNPTNSLEE